jgi:hypothetical protein
MAHTYTITSAVSLNGICTITGTVDGFPVTIALLLSAITALPNTIAVQAFIAPLMLAAAIATGAISPPAPTTVPTATAAGTWTA